MTFELHFLQSQFYEFVRKIGDFSEEEGEKFRQDIQELKSQFEEVGWNISTVTDYCWMLKRETVPEKRRRTPLYMSFEECVRKSY